MPSLSRMAWLLDDEHRCNCSHAPQGRLLAGTLGPRRGTAPPYAPCVLPAGMPAEMPTMRVCIPTPTVAACELPPAPAPCVIPIRARCLTRTVGKYLEDDGIIYVTLACPPPGGQRVPLVASTVRVLFDGDYDELGTCSDQIKLAISTGPRPASCDPPAPTWPCSAAACWIDTSDRSAVLAAYQAHHGGTTFGASHGDNSYGERARTVASSGCMPLEWMCRRHCSLLTCQILALFRPPGPKRWPQAGCGSSWPKGGPLRGTDARRRGQPPPPHSTDGWRPCRPMCSRSLLLQACLHDACVRAA
jgi:hypothetical protein